MNLQFLEEGHYKSESGEYMSIWTYKRKMGVFPNDTSVNYEDAKNIICDDRKWMPFNQSNRFKEGWHYNVACLHAFYGNN